MANSRIESITKIKRQAYGRNLSEVKFEDKRFAEAFFEAGSTTDIMLVEYDLDRTVSIFTSDEKEVGNLVEHTKKNYEKIQKMLGNISY